MSKLNQPTSAGSLLANGKTPSFSLRGRLEGGNSDGAVTAGEQYASRFFAAKDPRCDRFVFDLPSAWWSRPYEYAWASGFAHENDVVLDAGCGLGHPFKFFLADHCHEVHACDIDPRILSPMEMSREIAYVFGQPAAEGFLERYHGVVHYTLSSTTSLEYGEKAFDKIFCISVLEHLPDVFNQYPMLWRVASVRRFFTQGIAASLREFSRVLKDDGLIVLTFDYPRINLSYLKRAVSASGLAFAGDTSFGVSRSAVFSDRHGLYCFRAVLMKDQSISV